MGKTRALIHAIFAALLLWAPAAGQEPGTLHITPQDRRDGDRWRRRIMSANAISCIVFACLFGGALLVTQISS
jgi:hypothetical protein